MSTITTVTTITSMSSSTSPTRSYYTPARPAPRPTSPLYSSPTQRKKMSVTQTYYLAHKARGKLSREAGRPDHNLRLLVGHANLLDSLMLDLAEAEREQEAWFNQSVRGASSSVSASSSSSSSKTAHDEKRQCIQWADTVVEEPEDDWEPEDASTSDSDYNSDSYSSDSSDEDEEEEDGDVEMADAVFLRRVASNSNHYIHRESQPTMDWDDVHQENEEAVEFEDDDEDDEEEDYAQLTLTRSPSHSHSPPPPPELEEDDDTSDEDDTMMPPSPPNPVVHQFTEKEREAIVTTGFYPPSQQHQSRLSKDEFYDQGYYIPPRNPARLASAISVY